MSIGDHIYVQRLGGVYAHHGIDCGDGSVIHYTGEHWHTPRRVQRTGMDRFTRGGEVQVRDYTGFFETLSHPENLPRRVQAGLLSVLSRLLGRDGRREIYAPEAVIARAESRLGEAAFSLALHNCEHFATWCKTGVSDSAQIFAVWRATLGSSEYLRLRGTGALSALLERGWSLPGPKR